MKILQYPHGVLRAKARPVATIDKDLQIAAGEMLELMYKHEGLGLAAQQVGLDIQILVINFAGDANEKDQEVVAINPVILETKGGVKDREGCLSFPGLYQDIRRAETIKVQAYGLDGKSFEMVCSGLAARIWQHEIDHLNGMLFIDKMGALARMASKKYLESYIQEFDDGLKKGSIPPGTEKKL
ncbi:MAG: peptide deformylase [Fimbriiglobus sp.]